MHPMRPRQFLLPLLATIALACAAPFVPVARAAVRPSIRAEHITGPIRVDGVFDEPDWGRASPATDFFAIYAREGQAPSESTSVRVLFDERRIVIALWCGSVLPPRANVTPRDQGLDGDHISVHLDPWGDGRRAYIIAVNPYGVQIDGVLTEEPDFQWDGVWHAETKRVDGAWTAEIEVPFATLRYPVKSGAPWRLWVRRENTARNEVSSWPLWRQGESGSAMLQAGEIAGLAAPTGVPRGTIEPYVFAASSGERAFGGAKAPWTNSNHSEFGVDVVAPVTSELTLTATVHPDFSQIEADALLLDLNRRYPLSYDEKRPFFLEGAEIFQTPLSLVYTRRMSDPHWGVKASGQAGVVQLGALFVSDDGGAYADGVGAGPASLTRASDFALARAQVPLGEGRHAGVLLSSRQEGGAIPSFGPPDGSWHAEGTRNTVASLDAQWRFDEHWMWIGQYAHASSAFDSSVVTTDFPPEYESSRTRLRGDAWYAELGWRDRRNAVRVISRGFGDEFRDEFGFLERPGVSRNELRTRFRFPQATGALQDIAVHANTEVDLNSDGGTEYVLFNPWAEFEFRRSAWLSPGLEIGEERWLGRDYSFTRLHTYAEDNRWRPFTWSLETIVGDGILYADEATSRRAWTEDWSLNGKVRPRPWLTAAFTVRRLRVARSIGGATDVEQWLHGVNCTAQLTRRLGVRVYPQYDSAERHLGVNTLVSYVPHPGTAVHAGFNAGLDRIEGLRGPRTTARQFFTKLSYRFAY